MTDRELLEAAAKAAGMPATADGFHPRAGLVWIKRALGVRRETRWNPLVDSGDALDLAVKLKIDVTTSSDFKLTWASNHARGIQEVVKHESDPYAATRRAIVRAAATMAQTKETP